MSLGAVLEPLLVVGLLGTGVWLNRVPEARVFGKDDSKETTVVEWVPLLDEEGQRLLDEDTAPIPSHRQHQLRLGHLIRTVQTPNTAVHKNRLCSRVLRKFPFLVEVWYWALIYWVWVMLRTSLRLCSPTQVYAIGRPITALTLRDGTVDVARKHALTLVKLEQQLHFFEEARIQHFFLQYPSLMRWIGWLYSFVHIPGSIAFLIFLYWYINTRNRLPHAPEAPLEDKHDSPTGPELYEARRRTMAACNLLSFIVFTAWPCMPPRLLSDPNVPGEVGDLARSFGFVDTVHGANIGSVWTHHRFSHQYGTSSAGHAPASHLAYCSQRQCPRYTLATRS